MAMAAVRSALAQTHPPHEVIVVIDGPEDAGPAAGAAAALAAIRDTRLRVIALPASAGGGQARNLGVEAATGQWIAFLDDDDLWLKEKLAAQLAFAGHLPAGCTPVLSCPVLARSPRWEEVWPRERYRAGQSMAEYLFCRRGWRYGSALLQTSTLLAPRDLLLRIPFTPGLRKHQDWDWLLRVAADPYVTVHAVGRSPLVVFHVEGDRPSVGRARNWRFSLDWALARRQYFTPRAFTAFLATECAAQAQGECSAERAALLQVLFETGLPSGADLLRLAAFLFVPQTIRRSFRDRFRLRIAPARPLMKPAQGIRFDLLPPPPPGG